MFVCHIAGRRQTSRQKWPVDVRRRRGPPDRRLNGGWLHCCAAAIERRICAPRDQVYTENSYVNRAGTWWGDTAMIARCVEGSTGNEWRNVRFVVVSVATVSPFRATSFIRWLCDYRCYILPVFWKNEPNCERRRPPGRRSEHEKRTTRGHSAVGFGKFGFRVCTYRRCE